MTHTPGTRRIAVRGTLIALGAAAILGGVVFAVVMLMGGTVADAVRATAYVALGYLALNLVVLGIGLLLKPSDSWAIGAAVATPVILAAIGFGYAAYRAVPT
jgi:galactitol-specific phosphotransferase system IIC component